MATKRNLNGAATDGPAPKRAPILIDGEGEESSHSVNPSSFPISQKQPHSLSSPRELSSSSSSSSSDSSSSDSSDSESEASVAVDCSGGGETSMPPPPSVFNLVDEASTQDPSSSSSFSRSINGNGGHLGLDLSDSGDCFGSMDFLMQHSSSQAGVPVDPIFVDQHDSSHAAAHMHQLEEEEEEDFLSLSSSRSSEDSKLLPHPTVVVIKSERDYQPPLPPLPPLPPPDDEDVDRRTSPPPAPPVEDDQSNLDLEDVSSDFTPMNGVIKSEEPDSSSVFDDSSNFNNSLEEEEDDDEDEEVENGVEVAEEEDGSDGSDFDADELHDMLEKEVVPTKSKEDEIVPQEVKIKILLEEKGKSNFEVLPEGWIKVMHRSGMPVFLHRESRVASVTKPYYLGSGSIRRHTVPLESIPCLSYRKALDEEAQLKEERLQQHAKMQQSLSNGHQDDPSNPAASVAAACPILPKARVEVLDEACTIASVAPEELTEYCKRLFKFREIKIRKFKNWGDRRKFEKQAYKRHVKTIIENSKKDSAAAALAEKQQDDLDPAAIKATADRPSLPKGTKLITIPVVELETLDANHQDDALFQKIIKKSKKEWLLNPNGKSTVCILHEYIQHSLKKQPSYVFEEVDSSATPYSAKVIINGLEYGRGLGSSKKIAKNEAAAKTLEILIPEMKDKFSSDKSENEAGMPDLSFFDSIRIDDPRVSELCNKTSEPSPYAILVTCLQRNYGLGDTSIHTELKTVRHKKNEFYMRVNQKEVSVICKNKRDGKQMAAQKLLQQLHPHMKSWGSLLRLYGSRSIMSQKAKRERESEVTSLQSRNSSRPAPSLAILEKLKEEMRNLSAMKKSVTPIGKFVGPIDAGRPGNSTCLEKVDL